MHAMGMQLVLLLTSLFVSAPTPAAASSSTVSLRMFERLRPTELSLQGEHGLIVAGTRRPDKNIEVRRGDGVLLLGSARVSSLEIGSQDGQLWLDPGGGYRRAIEGTVRLSVSGASIQVVASMSLESYVAGVAEAEIAPAGIEALKAQAVLARTFFLKERPRHGAIDICDLTHCQVFKGRAGAEARQAAADTAGQVLVDSRGALATVQYFSTCGGATAAGRDIFGPSAPDYAVGVSDTLPGESQALCAASPHFIWKLERAVPEVLAMLGKELGRPLPASQEQPFTVTTDAAGWVTTVRVGEAGTLSGDRLHLIMGRAFGWNSFKSGRFTVEERGDLLVFSGRGLGHGVGLCQYGARELARRGKTYQEILAHYFPKLIISRKK